MTDRPIADYAFLSDCHGAALVGQNGRIDWWSTPRFDSPSLFARLLDPSAGHWRIGPSTDATARRYLDDTLVLETRFETDTGEAVLLDALAVGDGERAHALGRRSPHALLRVVRGVRGEVTLDFELAVRPEYGLVLPLLRATEGGVLVRGGAAVLMLSSPIQLQVEGSIARGQIRVRAGETVAFALEHRSSWEDRPAPWSTEAVSHRLDDTIEAWRSWSRIHQSYDGPWRDMVLHSGRVLQGLTWQPTGAIVAAATTSLPERVGGTRNWDYRFSWLRDASLTLHALWVAACPDEAEAWFDFVAHAALSSIREGGDLPIVFGVGGEHDLTERQLPHLSGWRDSRPVRVGNGAWAQRQIDVYGEILWAAERLKDQLADADDSVRAFLVDVVDAAAARWQEPDHGIWEARDEPQHHLYSKLMCWVALDRALALADLLDAPGRVPDWERARAEIRREILERGYCERVGAFAQVLDGDQLDASALMIPITGFLPADDPRVVSTIDAIERHLTDGRGLVWRYLHDDGLPSGEGTFLLCTFWLAQALALAGRVDEARERVERALACANDVGLFSEEVDAATGELLGNFPQAFSHVGFIGAAWAIAEADRARDPGRT